MAVLSDTDRAKVTAEIMRTPELVSGGAGGLSKAEVRAMVNGIDDWRDANAVEFNSAIPQPARSAGSSRQKAGWLERVVLRHFEVS